MGCGASSASSVHPESGPRRQIQVDGSRRNSGSARKSAERMARRVSSAGASVMSTLGLTMLELDNFVKLNAELIQKKGATLKTVIDEYILPRTDHAKCAYVDTSDGRPDPSIPRNFSEDAQVILLSVSLGVVMSDAIAAIERYMLANGAAVDGAVVLDALCTNQHRLDDLTMDDLTQFRQAAVQSVTAVLLVVSPFDKPDFVNSPSCLWDLYAGRLEHGGVNFMVPPGQQEAFERALLENYYEVQAAVTAFDYTDDAFLQSLEENAETSTERKYAEWLRRNAREEIAEVTEMQASLQAIVKSWLIEQAKGALEAVPPECKGIHLGLLQVAEQTASLGDHVEAEKMGQAAVDGCTKFYGPAHATTCRAVRALISLLTDLPPDGAPRRPLPPVAPFYPLGTGWSPATQTLAFLQKPVRRTASRAHGISWDPAFTEPMAIARRISNTGRGTSGKKLIVGVGAASRRSPEERFDLATRVLEQSSARLRVEYTSAHELTAAADRLLVEVYRAQRKAAAALPVARVVAEAARSAAAQHQAAGKDGAPDPEAAAAAAAERAALAQLSACLMAVGQLDEAEQVAREAAESALRHLGADSPEALEHTQAHALVLLELGRFGDAMPILRQTLGRREKAVGKLHRDTLASGCALAHALMFLSQQSAEGASRAARTLEDGGREFAESPPGLALQQEVSACLRKGGEFLWEAAVLLKTALVARDNELGDSHPSTVATGFALWDAMDRAGRSEAGPLLKLMVVKEEACSASLEEMDQTIMPRKSGVRALKASQSGIKPIAPPPIRATSSKYLGPSAPRSAASGKSGPQLMRNRSRGALGAGDKPGVQRQTSKGNLAKKSSFTDGPQPPGARNSHGSAMGQQSGKYGVGGPQAPALRNSVNGRSILTNAGGPSDQSGDATVLFSDDGVPLTRPPPKRQTTRCAFHPPFPMTGITLAGLRAFAADVAANPALAGRTTREVCRRFIVPATSEFQCPYVELLASRAGENAPSPTGQSSIFVSHAWDAPFDSLMRAVISHMEQLRVPPNSSPPAAWIDIFSINQHDDRPLPKTWMSGTMTDGLRNVGQLLFVLDNPSTPVAFGRIWCLYELCVALVQQTAVTFWVDRKDNDAPGISLARVDLGTALATNPTNRALVMITLQQGIGVDQANSLVRAAIQQNLKTRRPTDDGGYVPRALEAMPVQSSSAQEAAGGAAPE